jgi:hypothetical protein
MEYIVDFVWDEEAAVWVAKSKYIPGLVLESGSLDALIEKVKFAVPELLSLNNDTHKNINLIIKTEREVVI